MAKISRHGGPSYVDENGDPQDGPVPTETTGRPAEQLQIIPDAAEGTESPSRELDPVPTGPQPSVDGEGGQFDPSQHTVSEVNDYLATADDAERERVLNAEAGEGGKNRAGIMTGRAAGMATDPNE